MKMSLVCDDDRSVRLRNVAVADVIGSDASEADR
jgi:hypothetical protein